MADQYKIAIIVEAFNHAKANFDQLGRQIKGLGDESVRSGAASNNMLAGLKQNWIAVSAAVAAAGLAISKALDYMEMGAKAQQAEESFHRVAESIGEDANRILVEMKRVSAGTVDESDIMQKAVKGMTQGLSGNQLIQIMQAARITARTTGEDVSTAYESITDAIANKMPRTLQRYGLITREQIKLLNEAMAMGITEVDLFALAMENAGEKMKQFGTVQQNNAEKLQGLKALWKDIKEGMGVGLWDLIEGIKALGKGTVNVVMGMMSGFVTAIMGIFLVVETGLNKIRLRSDAELEKTKKDFENLKTMTGDFFSDAFGGGVTSLPAVPAAAIGASAGRPARGSASRYLQGLLAMKAREAEIQREIAQLDIAKENRDISRVDAARERLRLEERLLETQLKNLAPINDPTARAGKQKEIDETLRKISELRLALRELDGDFGPGIEEGFRRYLDAAETAFQQGIEMAQATAQAMEGAFSDFFFDVMTGKLKKLGEYVSGFLQAISRAIANMLAQQMAQQILAPFFAAPSGAASGAAAGAGAGVVHSGGLIMHAGGYVPRFHIGGFSSDERPAILQSGEYVVSRKGVAALDAINNGQAGGVTFVMNVDNKTGQPVVANNTGVRFDAQAKAFVVDVFLENIESNGPVRYAITGLR